jgi:hypothetical protein
MATLTDRVQAYLIVEGIVRDPRLAGPLPPCWRQPAEGVPAPGEGTGNEVGPMAVVAVSRSLGVPQPFLQGQWRTDVIDVVYRTLKWPDTEALYARVRAALIDHMGTTMAGMRVIQSVEWSALARIDASTAQGFTSRSAVLFQTYAEHHF